MRLFAMFAVLSALTFGCTPKSPEPTAPTTPPMEDTTAPTPDASATPTTEGTTDGAGM